MEQNNPTTTVITDTTIDEADFEDGLDTSPDTFMRDLDNHFQYDTYEGGYRGGGAIRGVRLG